MIDKDKMTERGSWISKFYHLRMNNWINMCGLGASKVDAVSRNNNAGQKISSINAGVQVGGDNKLLMSLGRNSAL